MSGVLIPLGEYGPAVVGLFVAAIVWVMIILEKRRRRLAAAAGRPLFDRPEAPGDPDGTGPVRQSLPLSREVFDYFRATGPGWQGRIDEVLRRHVRDEEERMRRRVAEARAPYRAEGDQD